MILKQVTYRNFLSCGNNPITIDLDKAHTTLISGTNGVGKCLHPDTKVTIFINNPETKKKLKDYLNAKDKKL